MMDRATIDLSGHTPLAKGTGRIVYRHPDRRDAVIKVHLPLPEKPLQRLRTVFRGRRKRYGLLLNSYVEIDEMAAIVARTGRVPDFATQFLGFVETSEGPGAVFEAVLDGSGLARHLKAHAWDKGHEPQIEAAIDGLWDQIAAARAVVSDPNITNVLVTRDVDAYRLTLVDGLGERTMIPILALSERAYAAHVAREREAMKAIYRQRAAEDGPSG